MWKKGFDNGLNGKQYVYINDEAPQVIHLNYDSSQIEKPEEIQKLVQIVINSNNFQTLSSFVSSLKPYGLRTDFLIIQININYQRCIMNDNIIQISVFMD